MTKGQLAILPVQDGRKAERRIVNLAARLRDRGATIHDVEIVNLSTDGFLAHGAFALEPGASVWLKLSGMEPQNSRVVWTEEGKAGFEFATPLHPATLELAVKSNRNAVPRRRFGAR